MAIRSSRSLAETITKSASKQTYYTIRWLADRDRIDDAYRAYSYFRWVDDVIDEYECTALEKLAFLHQQQSILETCYRGAPPPDVCPEERLLVELIRSDTEPNSGLQTYLRNMMGVMQFDALRRGRVITQVELAEYSHMLATAVTEAMYYFIGHNDPVASNPARYQAVTAAHITHMLRDAYEDTQTGYINIPCEYLQKHGMKPDDLESPCFQAWVRHRARLAHRYFNDGKECIRQIKNLRCRLAGFAYIARFEWMLKAIEMDGYRLRPEYPERKSLKAGLWMVWCALTSMFPSTSTKTASHPTSRQSVKVKEQ